MPPDVLDLSRLVTAETGLPLDGRVVAVPGAIAEYELTPTGHVASQSFRIRATLEWRSVQVSFQPGSFAGDLVAHMGKADATAQSIFREVLHASAADRAEVQLRINGNERNIDDASIWTEAWSNMSLVLRRGQIDVNSGDAAADLATLVQWTSRLAAAALALLPVEPEEAAESLDVTGYPEGAKSTLVVNRYERDRRNRAAAIAIHGYRCAGCQTLLSDRYGEAASSLIEIHHLTPVSRLGAGYVINPSVDLVALCPNCHAVVHTRTPPLSIEELRRAIGGAKESTLPETGNVLPLAGMPSVSA